MSLPRACQELSKSEKGPSEAPEYPLNLQNKKKPRAIPPKSPPLSFATATLKRRKGRFPSSAAPCRRARQEAATPHNLQRRFTSSPLLRWPPHIPPSRSVDCLWTVHRLPRDSLWSHLGALLVVFRGSCSPSWASYVALGALLGPPNAPLSSNLHSDKPTWRQHWPQLASQAQLSIDRCPSEPRIL